MLANFPLLVLFSFSFFLLVPSPFLFFPRSFLTEQGKGAADELK